MTHFRKRIIFSISLALFLFLPICLAFPVEVDTDVSFSFLDELENYNLSAFKLAGWTIIGNENYINFTNFSVILDNDCATSAWVRYFFNNSYNFTYWVAQSKGRWVSGQYGSLHVIVRTESHEYVWWGDGYYDKFFFFIDGQAILSKSGYNPGTNWHNFTLVFNNTFVQMLFDNETVFNYTLPYEKITGVGANSPWCSKNEYDLFSFLGIKTEIMPKLTLLISSPSQAFVNDSIQIYLEAYYNSTPLTNLTQQNFQLFLDQTFLSIQNFKNFTNGSYQFNTTLPPNLLGTYNLKLRVNYQDKSAENSTKIFIYNSSPFKEKILFITDREWQNVYSLVPLKKPILIADRIDWKILHFINLYQPEQIFILGNVASDINYSDVYKISSHEDVLKLFWNNESAVCLDKTEKPRNKAMLATQLAALLEKPIAFKTKDINCEYKLKEREEIIHAYLQKVKELGKNINYLIVAKKGDLLAPAVSAQKTGFILDLSPQVIEPITIMKNINKTVETLNSHGFFTNNTQYLLDGAYILLVGNITSIVKEDPVEKQKLLGLIGFDDPEDGDSFITDLEYGDLNKDTYLDVAVGRLPVDEEIASLMFARTLLPDNKKALVASEYLHTNWPSILLYLGGGMWHGRSMAKILEEQGYDVTRFVEHRSDPIDFLSSLAPLNVKSFLEQSEKIGETIGKFLGETIGSIISKVLIILKGLQYVEQGLEMYLEYDWNTFGPKLENALEYLDNIKQTLAEGENLTQEHAFQLMYILWPYPWEDVGNRTVLKQALPQHDIIYYMGIGNKTNWILPNTIPGVDGFLGIGDFFKDNYNGSNYFIPSDVQNLSSRLIWDSANFGGIGEMKDAFLENGTASLIGASALNYAQFSAEIDSRFFKQGWSIGTSLINAINDFRDDWLTWDPLNIVKPGIKAKTLREFILWGDPSLQKDPIIEPERYVSNITCINGICEQNVTIPITHELINTANETTIFVDTEDHLLELFRPIIPLVEFEYYLPFSATIVSSNLTTDKPVNFTDITLPRLELLQHGINYTNETLLTEWYPENIFRLEINSTIDNRTRIKLIHAAIRYNESSKEAIVYPKIHLNLKYLTPIEFSVITENITLGKTQDINVTIWSNISDNTTLYLQIMNSTAIVNSSIITKNITVGFNSFIYSFTPLTLGNYLVRAILIKHDPLIVGPRESVFKVRDIIPPTLLIHNYRNGSIYKPGDKLSLSVEVLENDVVEGDCQVRVGGQLLGSIPHSQGWCNGSVTLTEDGEGEKVINVTASDRSGNVGYNDSFVLIIKIPKFEEEVAPAGLLAPPRPGPKIENITFEKEIFPPIEEIKKEEEVAAICGNGVCEPGETQENCPEDCVPKIEEKEVAPERPTGFFVLVADKLPILLLVIVAIAIILILKLKVF
ncbi:MAG: C25 family cysteine peptidase [Candidatus Aenigmarchaeota archaeon]|nr:C25 family cysteine peptidase [Candidatus Aenigmarchaeota archaeon]